MLNNNVDDISLKWFYSDNVKLNENITLDNIIKESEDIKKSSTDFIINKKSILSRANEDGFNFCIDNKIYRATDWAVHYICTSHGVSKRYLSRLLHLAKETQYSPFIGLANDTINTFLSSPSNKKTKKEDNYLVRVIYGNFIRAIRSDSFKVKDNYPLLLDIKNTINEYYNVSSGKIDYNILILRMYLKENFKYLKKKINIGLQLKNSETGYYALQLQVLVKIDGMEFSSETLLNMRHNAKAISTVDVDRYIKDVALRYKNNILKAIKNIFKDNEIDEIYYSHIAFQLKSYLNKDDYKKIEKFSKKSNKFDLCKEILNVCKDYDFLRKERIESIIVDKILKLKIDMEED